MNSGFISQRDCIIVSAIELISESGLSALTTKNLAFKANITEPLLYKYFGGINEVLVEVVEFFVKFDKSIMLTISSKTTSNVQKIRDFFDAYATYYGNYKEITAIILNYEELLHNSGTRELVTNCITDRTTFLTKLIQGAITKGEISEVFSAHELANILTSIMNGMVLNRRVLFYDETLKEELMAAVNKILKLIVINE